MTEFRNIVAELKVKTVRFIPASTTRRSTTARRSRNSSGDDYTFDHKGVHFIVLDNVSDPARSSATRSSPGCGRPEAAGPGRAHRRLRAPSAVRSLSAVGLGHARRRARRSSC
jgi:hypothetical protein